jgi:DNA-binding IclR family transcriptional regulator
MEGAPDLTTSVQALGGRVRPREGNNMTKPREKTDKAKGVTQKLVMPRAALAGTQTLYRGLDVVDAVAAGAASLTELATAIGLTRSTTHRLATTLVERRYLAFSRHDGYVLGPKLLELGHVTARRMDLPRVAREHLEALSASTCDTVHLGILNENQVLYLDKVTGTRRVEVCSQIGERQPLRSTGLGKALMLDAGEESWRNYYDHEARLGNRYDVPMDEWLRRMREYAAQGYAFDLEENEDRIRCVAAPIRGVAGSIVGAISVTSAAQYMDDLRMRGLSFEVKKVAGVISAALGFNPAALRGPANPKPA